MSAPLPKRIIKETERLQSEPVPGISAEPHEDNARYFDVIVEGPDGSCYEGTVVFDDHPNVSPSQRLTQTRRHVQPRALPPRRLSDDPSQDTLFDPHLPSQHRPSWENMPRRVEE